MNDQIMNVLKFLVPEINDCLQKILNRLETLCAVQEQHSIVLQELLINSRLTLDVGCTERPEMMPDLPLATLTDLELWENFITSNKTNYTYACKLLSTVGGGNAAQTTRRMMKRLITSKLAQTGQAELRRSHSKSLQQNLLFLINSIKKSCGSTVGIENQIEDAIKDWLKYATIRVFSADKKKQSNFVFCR
ncbi:uncharacterized protein LOC120352152 [Nilaparvata lugens]|uniref:uncharacterized protein LOC120352152 n=1 Tax=Nilaparvata lugens TaxID=108931 RepID=UPI00193D78B7|nr:uncharacterized protein LOC120352152 [Nilaparvata lugens]